MPDNPTKTCGKMTEHKLDDPDERVPEHLPVVTKWGEGEHDYEIRCTCGALLFPRCSEEGCNDEVCAYCHNHEHEWDS